jgi:hypothetical protein
MVDWEGAHVARRGSRWTIDFRFAVELWGTGTSTCTWREHGVRLPNPVGDKQQFILAGSCSTLSVIQRYVGSSL